MIKHFRAALLAGAAALSYGFRVIDSMGGIPFLLFRR